MPSSVLFAALSVAWLAVLVPMFARRRQAVSRITDAALAARVVRRGSAETPAVTGVRRTDPLEETPEMPDIEDGATDVDPDLYDEYRNDGRGRRVYSDDVRAGRRYRPGRGGFDPEAAALVARAKYARRQRIVLFILLISVTTAVLAALLWSIVWWLHGLVDLVLVGYLVYLRRQVRIEEDVRNRRLARLSAPPTVQTAEEPLEEPLEDPVEDDTYDTYDEPEDLEEAQNEPVATAPHARPGRSAIALEIDDEDPEFDELDERTWEPYRRAAGE